MIKVDISEGERFSVSEPLTQWDYGQKMKVTGLTDSGQAEVHFSCYGRKHAISIDADIIDNCLSAKIPDELLQTGEDIKAYIYAVNDISGRTVYTITIPVKRRAKPEDYTEPEHHNKLEEIVRRLEGKADDIKYEDECLQLLSGEAPVGSRIRLPHPKDGKEIELKNDGTAIKWRYTSSNDWIELIKINDLKGKDGETPEFEIREGHLFAIYSELGGTYGERS